jgi:hypothetical protein
MQYYLFVLATMQVSMPMHHSHGMPNPCRGAIISWEQLPCRDFIAHAQMEQLRDNNTSDEWHTCAARLQDMSLPNAVNASCTREIMFNMSKRGQSQVVITQCYAPQCRSCISMK